jgi:hypothetical protein
MNYIIVTTAIQSGFMHNMFEDASGISCECKIHNTSLDIKKENYEKIAQEIFDKFFKKKPFIHEVKHLQLICFSEYKEASQILDKVILESLVKKIKSKMEKEE